jgi:hypothetical protein
VVIFGLVLAALGMGASNALAVPSVNIVRQGEPPSGKIPANTHYFKTIQSAVNASIKGDWVLIEPGVYPEEVWVEPAQAGIHIRGMNRNSVILDGENKAVVGGANGIEIFKTNNVSVENLTVRNFDRSSTNEKGEPELNINGEGGNEIWWNGGANSGKIGANRWRGRYLTAYDESLFGGYGIFTNNMVNGSWENIYASGFNDSGMYLGACRNCKARIFNAVMERNALGYSGSNSGGKLAIEGSTFRNNSVGLAPNSENPGDGPPPQNGACKPSGRLPVFTTTEIERCTVFRNNLFEDNNNLSTPANNSTAAAPWGVGVELPGVYADLIENNTITGNVNDGVLGFEYPNPFPPGPKTIFFQFAGNRISDNTFSGNGTSGATFAGDVALEGGQFGQMKSTNNCVSGNTFTSATFPANIEGEWGCQNSTTPNPGGGEAFIEYLLQLQGESQARTPEPQKAPPPQPTMPNPCQEVPYNPLCP